MLICDVVDIDDVIMIKIHQQKTGQVSQHRNYERFHMAKFSDSEFPEYFRFNKEHIPRLIKALWLKAEYTASNGIKSVNYQGLVPVLINALKEQDVFMKEQQRILSVQQSELDELKSMMKKIIER